MFNPYATLTAQAPAGGAGAPATGVAPNPMAVAPYLANLTTNATAPYLANLQGNARPNRMYSMNAPGGAPIANGMNTWNPPSNPMNGGLFAAMLAQARANQGGPTNGDVLGAAMPSGMGWGSTNVPGTGIFGTSLFGTPWSQAAAPGPMQTAAM